MQINMHRHNPTSVDEILLININTYRGEENGMDLKLMSRISAKE